MRANDASDPLLAALAQAADHLPDQGPIGVFVHYNTLHALQHLPFHDAVAAGAALRGAHPYLDEHEFRALWRTGRIEDEDIDAVLAGDTHTPVALGLTERAVRWSLLHDEIEVTDGAGVRFQLGTDTIASGKLRALWDSAAARLSTAPPRTHTPVCYRHRDVLVALGPDDPDVALHTELQRLSASFLDQGHALTTMPTREAGFLRAVAGLYAAGAAAPPFAPGADRDFAQIAAEGTDAAAVVRASLVALGVEPEMTRAFLTAELLALPGWAGMFSRLERHPEDPHGGAQPRLIDFVAVRLVLTRRALVGPCARAGLPLAWSELRHVAIPPALDDPTCAVHRLYGLARAAEASADTVQALTDSDLAGLFAAVDGFDNLARRRTFHEAYERRYRRQILDALAANRREQPTAPPPSAGRPRAQFVFCIDEREESIRRALEEQDASFETFGVAGFFGVAIDYQGLDDHRPAAHCPVVVVPAHEVHEAAVYSDRAWHRLRERLRNRWKQARRALESGSRGLSWGAVQSLIVGPLAGLDIASRVVAPRHAGILRDGLTQRLLPMPITRLQSLRAGEEDPSERGKHLGFTLAETVDRVQNTLTNIGLIVNFAPVVVILGHGSTSLNNPHESAHDCGACGGRRGGANARVFAEMANRPDVREALALRGISVPTDTWFVGALHDTADDSVRYYDLHRLPQPRALDVDVACAALEGARAMSALERTRRFDDALLDLTPEEGLRHVESRAASLAQPRPEYGHCTNAVCVVGRRALTYGLFLDRRAFLVSYDPPSDVTHKVLERILAAVGPVGAGINLEYYFSTVDNERYGCGTKLPHNVTGLIGVMNGHQGDLRTGLPLQMVEIHEPMRLLLIVEATPDTLLAIAGNQPEVCELVVNAWVQLVSVDPDTGAMSEFRDGAFLPYTPALTPLPRVARSVDWFRQGRQHLPPAKIEAPNA